MSKTHNLFSNRKWKQIENGNRARGYIFEEDTPQPKTKKKDDNYYHHHDHEKNVNLYMFSADHEIAWSSEYEEYPNSKKWVFSKVVCSFLYKLLKEDENAFVVLHTEASNNSSSEKALVEMLKRIKEDDKIVGFSSSSSNNDDDNNNDRIALTSSTTIFESACISLVYFSNLFKKNQDFITNNNLKNIQIFFNSKFVPTTPSVLSRTSNDYLKIEMPHIFHSLQRINNNNDDEDNNDEKIKKRTLESIQDNIFSRFKGSIPLKISKKITGVDFFLHPPQPYQPEKEEEEAINTKNIYILVQQTCLNKEEIVNNFFGSSSTTPFINSSSSCNVHNLTIYSQDFITSLKSGISESYEILKEQLLGNKYKHFVFSDTNPRHEDRDFIYFLVSKILGKGKEEEEESQSNLRRRRVKKEIMFDYKVNIILISKPSWIKNSFFSSTPVHKINLEEFGKYFQNPFVFDFEKYKSNDKVKIVRID